MKTSESLTKFAPAFIKAQASMKDAVKDTVNPFFKSHFAGLNSVWNAAKDALHENGFTVTQPTTYRDGVMLVETIVLHSSGEWIAGEYLVTTEKPGPQAVGASVSYAKRYALSSILGIMSGDVDDDAESATDHDKPAAKAESKPVTKPTEAAQKVFGKSSESPTNYGEVLTARFIPKVYTAKVNKSGKMNHSVLDPETEQWYSTQSEEHAKILGAAKSENKKIVLAYKMNGTFRNIQKVYFDEVVPEPQQEGIPF